MAKFKFVNCPQETDVTASEKLVINGHKVQIFVPVQKPKVFVAKCHGTFIAAGVTNTEVKTKATNFLQRLNFSDEEVIEDPDRIIDITAKYVDPTGTVRYNPIKLSYIIKWHIDACKDAKVKSKYKNIDEFMESRFSDGN